MANWSRSLPKLSQLFLQSCTNCMFKQPVRHGWTRLVSRGKKPEDAKSLSMRLQEKEAKDPALDRDINIGFPRERKPVPRRALREWSRMRKEKEQTARLGKLTICTDDIRLQYEEDEGLDAAHSLSEHYGIFRDLFDNAFFIPNTRLQVQYDFDEEYVFPVYCGNRLQPSQTPSPPSIHYQSDPSSLWSLILTNPDGHLQDNSAEVLHWFVSNIPGKDIEKGEIICDYLRPFPPKGTGFHRYVFILYKQDRTLDLRSEKRPSKCTSLAERTFRTLDFYRDHQDHITPAGIAFFQAEWDESVTETFHQILDMAEPSFEYVHPPMYHPQQVKFPKKKPFDLYLDRYRDIMDIREEVLREKMKMISPFSPHPKRPQFPNIYRLPLDCPQWLRTKIQSMRLRKKHWSDLP